MTFQIKKKTASKTEEVNIYINTHFKHIIVKRMINFLIINLHKYLKRKIFYYMEKLDSIKTLFRSNKILINIKKGIFFL